MQSDENKAEIKIIHCKSPKIVKLDYFVHCTPICLSYRLSIDASLLLSRIEGDERSVASKDQ